METYNLYCDETCHLEKDGSPYMILGYIKAPYNSIKIHKNEIKQIKENHNFKYEIKWSKVSASKSDFYQEIVDYFFASNLSFRALVVNKSQIDHLKYNQTHDTFYYKMYYQLINHKLDMNCQYNIYLDIVDSLSSTKVKRLKEILLIDKKSEFDVIKKIQSIHSKEIIFNQLTDLLIGAIGYYLRDLNKVIAKNKIIEKIQKKSNYSLKFSTSKSEEKFNLFFIEL